MATHQLASKMRAGWPPGILLADNYESIYYKDIAFRFYTRARRSHWPLHFTLLSIRTPAAVPHMK